METNDSKCKDVPELEDWDTYGKCHLCRSLAVEDIGVIGKPVYFCLVCKTQYSKYS
jgi:hypothetical protein